jgi:hypothetical protein
MLRRWYTNWIGAWEHELAHRDTNRVVRPFEWGFDWLGLRPEPHWDPAKVMEVFSRRAAERSEAFFAYETPRTFRLDGQTLTFASPSESGSKENNTVYAEYFPAPNANGRAVVVIPQWNSDAGGHIGLCKLINRAGISALRLSIAYHHQRMPPELQRADYHVSSNLGRTIHATQQSVIDTRACLDWLESRGYGRLGVLGTSLGSCVALLAVAHDERPKTAVFNHVSMNFSDVVWTGVSCRHIRQSLEGNVNAGQLRAAWKVISPSAYLDRLSGRKLESLIVWASHDTTFLPEYSKQVLAGFQERALPHRVTHLPCGHYTSGRFPFNLMDGYAMVRHLAKHL